MKTRLSLFLYIILFTHLFSFQAKRQSNLPSELFIIFNQLTPETVEKTQMPNYLNNLGKLDFTFQQRELTTIKIKLSKRKSNKFTKFMNNSFKAPLINTPALKKWIFQGVSFSLLTSTKNIDLIIEKAVFDGQNKLDLPTNTYILDFLKENVYDNNQIQTIYLLGQPFEDNSVFFKQVWLYSEEEEHIEEMIFALPDPHHNGYNYQLNSLLSTSIESETSDSKRHYTIISSSTGGSGGIQNILIMDLKDKFPKPVLKSDSISFLDFSGKYLPDYQAILYLSDQDSVLISQKNKKTILDEAKIYENGNLTSEITLWGNFPVAYDCKPVNKKYNKSVLMIYQEVRGFANYDRIALIKNYLFRKNNEWIVQKREIEVYK